MKTESTLISMGKGEGGHIFVIKYDFFRKWKLSCIVERSSRGLREMGRLAIDPDFKYRGNSTFCSVLLPWE